MFLNIASFLVNEDQVKCEPSKVNIFTPTDLSPFFFVLMKYGLNEYDVIELIVVGRSVGHLL